LTVLSSADKIRALMPHDPLQPLDFHRLTKEQAIFSGDMSLDSMKRILDLLDQQQGNIHYQLGFDKSEQGQTLIDINIDAELVMSCQRCLSPMQVRIARHSILVIVNDKTELHTISSDYEPYVVEENGNLSLHDMVQDELLLTIPLAPIHDEADCGATSTVKKIKEESKINPFAILERSKKKTN